MGEEGRCGGGGKDEWGRRGGVGEVGRREG